jgi:hypothetical protein
MYSEVFHAMRALWAWQQLSLELVASGHRTVRRRHRRPSVSIGTAQASAMVSSQQMIDNLVPDTRPPLFTYNISSLRCTLPSCHQHTHIG